MNIRVNDVRVMLKGLHSLEELRLYNVDLGKLPTDLLWRFSKLKVGVCEFFPSPLRADCHVHMSRSSSLTVMSTCHIQVH